MRQILSLFTILILVLLSACTNREAQPIPQEPTVPTAIRQAVQKAYPMAVNLSFTQLDQGKIWDSKFTVETIPHQAKINAQGTILEVFAFAGIQDASNPTLPVAARVYIRQQYANWKAMGLGKGQYLDQKAYKVVLMSEKSEVTLLFDEKGILILEGKATPTPADGGAEGTSQSYPLEKPEELPAAITQYLAAQGLTFAKGLVLITSSDQKSYFLIALKGATSFELHFDAAGQLVRSSSITPSLAVVELKSVGALPEAAVAYLNGYTFTSGIAMTVPEGQTIFIIMAQKEGKLYEITFDPSGKVISSLSIVEDSPKPPL